MTQIKIGFNLLLACRSMEWWKYYYDYENRLTKVEYFDGTENTVLSQYYYDGDGKRMKKPEPFPTRLYSGLPQTL